MQYQNLYAGVNLVFYGKQRQFEYDFLVSPGADLRAIKLDFDGAQQMRVDANGDLVLSVQGGEIRHLKPVVYQEVDGVKMMVKGRYVISGKNQVGFAVGAYDASKELVIDPTLDYATYLGGNGDDYGNAIASDGTYMYVTGSTTSPVSGGAAFPTAGSNAYSTSNAGNTDVFVSKINPAKNGNSDLVWSTYIGGSQIDVGQGIAVKSISGYTDTQIFVTGFTNSSNFPVTSSPVQGTLGGSLGNYDAFALRLDTSASSAINTLLYSTFHGGDNDEKAYGILIDSFNKAIITGYTQSSNMPKVLSNQASLSGLQDTFVVKFNLTMSGRDYSIYLGGNGSDTGRAIATSSAGLFITGDTTSTDTAGTNTFPATTGAYQTTFGGVADAFVTKVGLIGSKYGSLISTLLGGDQDDKGFGIKADSSNIYVAGHTATNLSSVTSTSWPATTGAYQTTFGGTIDAFVTKINTSLTTLSWSTYIGGSGDDRAFAVAVDSSSNVYVTGWAASGFPEVSRFQTSGYGGGNSDAFVTKVNSSGASLSYSSFHGGSGDDSGQGIAVDSSGTNSYVTGYTASSNFPVKPSTPCTSCPFDTSSNGANDAFVTKIIN